MSVSTASVPGSIADSAVISGVSAADAAVVAEFAADAQADSASAAVRMRE
ncbi:hypothetical protein NIA69_20805 [Gemmiger formicilis]|nr:hypothetical protein [Gemmiger formicilis]